MTRRHTTPACVLDGWGHPKAMHATDVSSQSVNTKGYIYIYLYLYSYLYLYLYLNTYIHISRDFHSVSVVVNFPSSENHASIPTCVPPRWRTFREMGHAPRVLQGSLNYTYRLVWMNQWTCIAISSELFGVHPRSLT